ncbi:hypothetical protein BGZ79_000079 [Entomortierella chlamydospora]|nr:hypothetical protein BGZ79_000079 [Entomortierella chlamydospora]
MPSRFLAEKTTSTHTPLDRIEDKATRRKPFVLGDRFFLLTWFHLWVFPLIHRCRKQRDTEEVPIVLAKVLTAKVNGDNLDAKWKQELANAAAASRSPKLINALFNLYGIKYILIGLWKLIWAACTWTGAYYFLRQMFEFLEGDTSSNAGHMYAMGLLLTSLGSSIAIHQLYSQCNALGIQVKASISVLIYRKTLVLARIRDGAEVINIVSADVARIVEAVTNFHFLWSSVVEIIIILVLAFPTLGWAAALSAIGLVVAVLPIQAYLGRIASDILIKQTVASTERVHLTSEILTAIKLIKFSAWEAPFQDRVNQTRARELHLLKRYLQVKGLNMTVVFVLPAIITAVSLVVYNARRNGPLESSVVFTALSIFNTLQQPIFMLPIAVKSTSGARMALHRLDDYLTQPELEPLEEHPLGEGGDVALELQDGEFTWDDGNSGPVLSGINLKIKRGEVVAIVGDVGSGKSSLIAALLGQIRQTGSGPKLKLYGKSSYVPRKAWMINANIRENIVFGKDFEQERYDTVIKVCALERDLTLLSHGDMTEIGERGSNLSGDQKQRVSFARAVYQKSDIILLDDPLSAVDQNVGKHIFDQCIRGYLSDRTVIIAIHQLEYLHRCDKIVMLRDGKIAYQGSFEELMSNEPSFNTLINTYVSSEDDECYEGDASTDGESKSQTTIDDSASANASNLPNRGAERRRYTLPPNTWIGDTPGTTSISSQKHDTLIPQEQYNQLNRLLTRASRNSILNSTLRDQKNLHFISHADDVDGFSLDTDFSRTVSRNELAVHSFPENGLYESRRDRAKGRHSITEAPIRRSSTVSYAFNFGAMNEDEWATVTRDSYEPKDLDESTSDDESSAEEEKVGERIVQDNIMDELGLTDYIKYFRVGSGTLVTLLLIFPFLVAHIIRIVSNFWLRLWVPNNLHSSDSFYLWIYAALITVFALIVLTRGFWFAHEATYKSKELHARAFKSVMRAPMSFFETNSLGRILSAFSKSMFTVDNTLLDNCLLFLQYFPVVLGGFFIIAIVVHWQNTITVICLLLIAIGFVWYGSPADSKLKQMEVLSKPPVFQHISTTLEGLFSIRAYNVQKSFDYMNMVVLDKNHESLFAMLSTKTWTGFYLDILSSFMVYSTALFLVIYRYQIHQVSAVAGLALTNALQMPVFIQSTIYQMREIQAQTSAVGHLDYYGRQIEPEAPAENLKTQPDESWPREGRIDFDHLVLKYGKDSPPALRDVSFSILPKEKVGIVGSTGSGKSTLLVGLLRIVEASRGTIYIDGIDISTLGLNDLRTKVGVISQEPVLFVGTIRSNLDPFGQHEDNALWRALDAVHLGDKVREMPLRLDSSVVENGKNFSLGQRQLICIARSLVIGSKIIVLDEAAASMDMVTDKLLQEATKENFADCTVLTIAHRMNTIIESDKVLVMDGGVVAEFGEPYKLLQNPDGVFARLVSHTGEAASKKLAMTAKDAHNTRERGQVLEEENRASGSEDAISSHVR